MDGAYHVSPARDPMRVKGRSRHFAAHHTTTTATTLALVGVDIIDGSSCCGSGGGGGGSVGEGEVEHDRVEETGVIVIFVSSSRGIITAATTYTTYSATAGDAIAGVNATSVVATIDSPAIVLAEAVVAAQQVRELASVQLRRVDVEENHLGWVRITLGLHWG